MKKMFLLFSHQLTKEQINDAKKEWQVEDFVYLTEELQEKWGNFCCEKASIKDDIKPFEEFLKLNAKKDDLVLIQGDFGAVFSMVNFAKSIELISVYATTKRSVEEIKQGNKTIKKSVFEHKRFRVYE